MKKYLCKIISDGFALGNIYKFRCKTQNGEKLKIQNADDEIKKLHQAVKKCAEHIDNMREIALSTAGKEGALIFDAYSLIMKDASFISEIENRIRYDLCDAQSAVSEVVSDYEYKFCSIEDDYIRERISDVRDIGNRLKNTLDSEMITIPSFEDPVIIVCQNISPTELLSFESDKILGIVAKDVSKISHTAILCQSMNIPLAVCPDLEISALENGEKAIIDGSGGAVIFSPDGIMKMMLKSKIKDTNQNKKTEVASKTGSDVKNLKTDIYASISGQAQLEDMLSCWNIGVGLYRTEFLYMVNDSLPSEGEQFKTYSSMAKMLGNKPFIIRTFDFGGDKTPGNIDIGSLRGVEVYRKYPRLLNTQLRAIYRASVNGNLRILFPMIKTAEDIEFIKEVSDAVVSELSAEKIDFKVPQMGIMIETLEAVKICDILSLWVDFLCIGTNDLSASIFGFDRFSAESDDLYLYHAQELIGYIEQVVRNAHEKNKIVGICGELAYDTDFLQSLKEIEIDYVSVPPSKINDIRTIIETR